jgi:acetyl esterase/lipase
MVGAFAAALAQRCDVEVICPAYRLAPEFPFPSGLADAQSVLLGLGSENKVPLIISGDSAGGGLAASLAALAVAERRRVAGLVLLSPWLDLTVTSRSFEVNAATDPLFSRAAAEEAAALYLQGISARDPLASPLFAPVSGFPPTFISIGEEEVLADDGRSFSQLLRSAGVKVTFCPIAAMEHVAVTRNLELPGARETFTAVVRFIESLGEQRTTS